MNKIIKKEKINNKNKLINIFIMVSIIMFGIFLLLVIFEKKSHQLNVFYGKFNDLFADFYNVLMYISKRDPYNNLINGLAEKAYLPISYLILYPFSIIGKYYYNDSLNQCYTNIGIFLAFTFTLLSISLFSFSCKKLCEKLDVNKKILIPIYISGIFMYTIERGNLILISVALLMLFLTYYNSENKYKRLFASFCLALTTCLKFYPVVFGLLYLKEKRYKDAINAAVFAIIFAFVPFLFFHGGFSNIELLFRNMDLNSQRYNSVNMFSGLSIRNLVNYIFYGNLKFDASFVLNFGDKLFYILAGLSIITAILSLFRSNKFNIISSLFFMTIFLQSNSRFYCILYIIPVYILMFKEINDKNYKKWLLLILYFLIIFMPIRILYNTLPISQPINEYLTVLLTIIFFIIVCINVFKEFIKGLKKEEVYLQEEVIVKMKNSSITVVLLAYKEEENLKVLLPEIIKNIEKTKQKYNILVVDTEKPLDNTKVVCEKYNAKYINQEYPKFAGAFKTAIKYADNDLFLIMDSDGSHNPKYIPDIYNKYIKENCDVVIGSRYVKGGKTNDSKSSIIMSKILNTCFRLFLGIKAHDISTDYRLYNTKSLKEVKLNNENYDVLQEVLLKLKLNNNNKLKIGEVPITFEKRLYGESKRQLIPFIISYIKSLFKLTNLRISYNIKNKFDKKLLKQLFRFGVVGGTAFIIDYGLLYLLTDFCKINYLISGAISFIVSLIYNYILSIKWVFDTGHKQTVKDVIIFCVLSTIGLGINELIMYIGADKFYINYLIVKIFATAVVMVYNFITRKIFIEKK